MFSASLPQNWFLTARDPLVVTHYPTQPIEMFNVRRSVASLTGWVAHYQEQPLPASKDTQICEEQNNMTLNVNVNCQLGEDTE